MIRAEVIPYNKLDEQLEIALSLRQKRQKKQIKHYHDLGNCFLVYLYKPDDKIRW